MKTPHLSSPAILPFVGALAAAEGLLLWYWVALRLGTVLLYGAMLVPLALFTGKQALVSLAERRAGVPVVVAKK
jgi:oligosaccharyltransferase complex subunit delta (ribophorin II)